MSPPTPFFERARQHLLGPLLAVLLSALIAPALVAAAPPASAHGTGTDLDAAGLEAMIYCESLSHGRYATSWSSRAPFAGAVQWVQSTWDYATVAAGYPQFSGQLPNLAPPAVQDAVTYDHWSRSSPDQQWPVCHARAVARIGTGDPGPYRVCGTDEWSTGPWSRAHPDSCPTYSSAATADPFAVVAQPIAYRDGSLLSASGELRMGGAPRTILACDVDGNGVDEPVIVDSGNWSVDLDRNGQANELVFRYGTTGDLPICGDTNGDGIDEPVVVRDNSWHVRHSWSGGGADLTITFGRGGDVKLLCDVDGDGRDDPVVVRNALRFIDLDHRGGAAEATVAFGRSGDGHLCGDLDNDGTDDMIVTRSRIWYVSRTWRSGVADVSFAFGRVGDEYLVG